MNSLYMIIVLFVFVEISDNSIFIQDYSKDACPEITVSKNNS